MKYEKPQFTLLAAAAEAIQATTKSIGMNDNPEDLPSTAAYEADE